MTFSLLQAGARGRTGAARTLLRKAEERVDDGGIHLKMDEPLFAQRLISERELQLTRELTAIRGKEVPEARDRLKLLEAGNRPEEIDATAAGLNRLKAQRTYVGTAARVVKSASPVDGIVISHRLREMRTLTVEINVPVKETFKVDFWSWC